MRNQRVLVQIQTVEELLVSSGVTSYCLECIHGPKGGCCQRCPSLGPNGCTDKPLSCALWLCHEADRAFPEVEKELRQIQRQWPSEVSMSYRRVSIMNEITLTEEGLL